MPITLFRGRRAIAIENDALRITVLCEGGHIAEIYNKAVDVNPLWIPGWPSIEPSLHHIDTHPIYGRGSDAKLLAGIMGHNVCLDLFGGPSQEEFAAGITAHGEASIGPYELVEAANRIIMRLQMPLAQLSFQRTLELHERGVHVREIVNNLTAMDRPIAWTQHVTLGPPFLEPSTTEFRASVQQSLVSSTDPGANAYLVKCAEFNWPHAPRADGGTADLRTMHKKAPASCYTAHLAAKTCEHAFFTAFSPRYRLALSYIWKRADFPWLGIWEENCSRQNTPWNGNAVARGMEFGVSPIPESRREMVERASRFGAPMYRWLSANGQLEAEYWIKTQITERIPEDVLWPDS